MRTATEFESTYHRIPIQLLGENAGSGVLLLEGSNSALQLTGIEPAALPTRDENGWFDLSVQTPKGVELLLKNAIVVEGYTNFNASSKIRFHNARIFPNYVIENANHLDNQRRVNAIYFTIEDSTNFFDYKYIDWIEKSDNKELFDNISNYCTDIGDISYYNEIFAINGYPEFFSFSIGGARYSVHAGFKRSFNFHCIDHKIFAVASIRFEESVEFKIALRSAWSWLRLFSQQVMYPYSFERLSVSGPQSRVSCDVYLPNEIGKSPPTNPHYKPDYLKVCFNQWDEREKAANAHMRWLIAHEKRQAFRSRVDRVIQNFAIRTETRDIVELAAAIDGLSELDEIANPPFAIIDLMANSAFETSLENGGNFSLERIRGTLGNLTRASLTKKINSLCQQAGIPLTQRELLAKKASRLRHKIAHGAASADQLIASARPTIEALLCACINFDLRTSGFSLTASSGQKTIPKQRFDDALEELSRETN